MSIATHIDIDCMFTISLGHFVSLKAFGEHIILWSLFTTCNMNMVCYRSYSYYIEVSMDDRDWIRIIDHTRYLCRSWQYLRFKARVVR